MNVPVEIWLVLGIIGFYLYDSVLMLSPNELVLMESGGRWHCFVPRTDVQFGGKYLFLPNPLLPVQTLYRLDWLTPSADRVDSAALKGFLAGQRYLRPVVGVLFILLAFALPAAVALVVPLRLTLALLGETYLFICVALALIYWQRAALKLDGKGVAKLASDALLCAPFSLNLVRKLGLGYAWRGDTLQYAREVLKPEAFEEMKTSLLRRIERDLEMTEDGDAHSTALIAVRQRLVEATP